MSAFASTSASNVSFDYTSRIHIRRHRFSFIIIFSFVINFEYLCCFRSTLSMQTVSFIVTRWSPFFVLGVTKLRHMIKKLADIQFSLEHFAESNVEKSETRRRQAKATIHTKFRHQVHLRFRTDDIPLSFSLSSISGFFFRNNIFGLCFPYHHQFKSDANERKKFMKLNATIIMKMQR